MSKMSYKLLFVGFLVLVTTTYQLWQQYFSVEVRVAIGLCIATALIIMYIQLIIRLILNRKNKCQ